MNFLKKKYQPWTWKEWKKNLENKKNKKNKKIKFRTYLWILIPMSHNNWPMLDEDLPMSLRPYVVI
jgi:hypothetical protein